MEYVYGCYFRGKEEADSWLPFDSDEQIIDEVLYSDPDRYEEWRLWRDESS